MLRAAEPASAPAPSPGLEPTPQSFLEVVALFDRKREALLRSHLFANVHLVRFEPGRIELPCQAAKAGELPPGALFLPYGDLSNRLMGGDAHGAGMPNSKCFEVELERV